MLQYLKFQLQYHILLSLNKVKIDLFMLLIIIWTVLTNSE